LQRCRVFWEVKMPRFFHNVGKFQSGCWGFKAKMIVINCGRNVLMSFYDWENGCRWMNFTRVDLYWGHFQPLF
jgi:hypothetical protein